MENEFVFYNFLPVIADHIIDSKYSSRQVHHNYPIFNENNIKEGDTIFVKADFLKKFFKKNFKLIKNKFYLITGVSDLPIDEKYFKYINNNKIIKWVGCNILINHEKILKLPIGFQENELPGGNQKLLKKIYNNKILFKDKKNKLLLTYISKSHQSREDLNEIFNNKEYVDIINDKLNFKNYMEKINEYKFVLSPRGYGPDTHRFWEILLVGSVPIVESSGLDDLYEKFPCIIVKSFSDINKNLLDSFNYDLNKSKNITKYLNIKNFIELINENKNLMNALYLSHNGIGDNIYNIGALRFLLKFYNKIYFICNENYFNIIKYIFIDTDKIILIPYDSKNQRGSIKEIINEIYKSNDIFVSGSYHKKEKYGKSKIKNEFFLKAIEEIEPNKYSINHDFINDENYSFIENFYKDNGMNLNIFFDFFYIPETYESKKLFKMVENYKIIFLQTTTSDNNKLNITKLIERKINDSKTILISNDENLYDSIKNPDNEIIEKRNICKNFIKTRIPYYLDVIKNSLEIYLIDSCFVGIVLPLLKTNKLKAKIVRIITRENAHKVEL